MGRGPISHPPGLLRYAFLHLAAMAPKKTIYERISLIRFSGITQQFTPLASIIKVSFSLLQRQPKFVRILIDALTSDRSGQLCITLVPSTSYVAARIGRTLFLAPCTVVSPQRGIPPSIRNFSILSTPFNN